MRGHPNPDRVSAHAPEAELSAGPDVHVPVLCAQVVDALRPADGGLYVDGTFGAGGYSRAILAAADCRVVGIDRDPAALARGRNLQTNLGGRGTALSLIEGRFGDMEQLVRGHLPEGGIDGVALDLGLSSPQLDEAERGFSFRFDGPLDMRMGESGDTAADLVRDLDETDLADTIFRLGEERFSRRIARAIVVERSATPITRTGQLAEIVRRAMPPAARKAARTGGIDPATRTFQALRIAVNDELGELGRGLSGAERLLQPGGRLAVVSFHSLEDRIAKNFMRSRSGSGGAVSRHRPETFSRAPSLRLVSNRAIRPDEAECARNPRARSARLRVAERTSAPAWPSDALFAGEAA